MECMVCIVTALGGWCGFNRLGSTRVVEDEDEDV